MAKKVRFPLVMPDGVEARTIEELREHFDLNRVREYYKDGKLITWLEDRYYTDEVEKVRNLNPEEKDFATQLCLALEVGMPEGEVQECWDSGEALAEIDEDISELQEGVQSAVANLVGCFRQIAELKSVKQNMKEEKDCLEQYTFEEKVSVVEDSVNDAEEGVVERKRDEEKFEDMPIFDFDDIRVDFCGLEFNKADKVLNLKIWSYNNDNIPVEFWVKDLRVNGNEYESIELLGTLKTGESKFTDKLIQNVEGVSYEDITEIEFEIEMDDTNGTEIFDSKRLKVLCNTVKESFEVEVLREEMQWPICCEEDVSVEFLGLRTAEDDKTLTIKLWSVNNTKAPIKLYIKTLTVNGILQERIDFIGAIQAGERQRVNALIQNVKGVLYKSIETIEFEIEIDTENSAKLYDSKRVKIEVRGTTYYTWFVDNKDILDVKQDKDAMKYEDIPILATDKIEVDFCGVEFEKDNRVVKLSVWSRNNTKCPIKLRTKNLIINDKKHIGSVFIGTVKAGDNGYMDGLLHKKNGVSYKRVKRIEFEVEIVDENDTVLYASKRIRVYCGASTKRFVSLIRRDKCYRYCPDREEISENMFKENLRQLTVDAAIRSESEEKQRQEENERKLKKYAEEIISTCEEAEDYLLALDKVEELNLSPEVFEACRTDFIEKFKEEQKGTIFNASLDYFADEITNIVGTTITMVVLMLIAGGVCWWLRKAFSVFEMGIGVIISFIIIVFVLSILMKDESKGGMGTWDSICELCDKEERKDFKKARRIIRKFRKKGIYF